MDTKRQNDSRLSDYHKKKRAVIFIILPKPNILCQAHYLTLFYYFICVRKAIAAAITIAEIKSHHAIFIANSGSPLSPTGSTTAPHSGLSRQTDDNGLPSQHSHPQTPLCPEQHPCLACTTGPPSATKTANPKTKITKTFLNISCTVFNFCVSDANAKLAANSDFRHPLAFRPTTVQENDDELFASCTDITTINYKMQPLGLIISLYHKLKDFKKELTPFSTPFSLFKRFCNYVLNLARQ